MIIGLGVLCIRVCAVTVEWHIRWNEKLKTIIYSIQHKNRRRMRGIEREMEWDKRNSYGRSLYLLIHLMK